MAVGAAVGRDDVVALGCGETPGVDDGRAVGLGVGVTVGVSVGAGVSAGVGVAVGLGVTDGVSVTSVSTPSWGLPSWVIQPCPVLCAVSVVEPTLTVTKMLPASEALTETVR